MLFDHTVERNERIEFAFEGSGAQLDGFHVADRRCMFHPLADLFLFFSDFVSQKWTPEFEQRRKMWSISLRRKSSPSVKLLEVELHRILTGPSTAVLGHFLELRLLK